MSSGALKYNFILKVMDKIALDKSRPEYHRITINWNASETDGCPVAKSTGKCC